MEEWICLKEWINTTALFILNKTRLKQWTEEQKNKPLQVVFGKIKIQYRHKMVPMVVPLKSSCLKKLNQSVRKRRIQ